MQTWLAKALEAKDVELLKWPDRADGVYCMAWEHEWYSDGVVMDWSALHRGLSPKTHCLDVKKQMDSVMRFCCDMEDGVTLVTSIELRAPWRIIELSEQAQRLSAFISSEAAGKSGDGVLRSVIDKDTGVQGYRFIRGPPGQRSVRDDLYALLQNVGGQLFEGGVKNHIFFGSVIVASDSFEELMHHTAAVHRALKSVGFNIYGNRSSFEPRRVFVNSSRRSWSTLTLNSLRREEDIVAFIVDLFYMWLEDCYVWLCETPPRALLLSSGREDTKLHCFSDFYTVHVRPQSDEIGFLALKDMTLEEILELAQPKLLKKVECLGPQKWSTLELRLCLCDLNAYASPPCL